VRPPVFICQARSYQLSAARRDVVELGDAVAAIRSAARTIVVFAIFVRLVHIFIV
jgi:hypothetical protein